MLKRLVALVVFALTLSAIPAFAQYTVIDANGTVVGNVVTVITPDNDVSKVAVATQDANGLWVFMELVKEGFILSGLSEIMNTLVYYTDAACATTPYLAFPGGPPQFTPTPLFRRLVSGRRGEVVTQGYYGTDPVAIITVRSQTPPAKPVA
jgi:hypothetical protein